MVHPNHDSLDLMNFGNSSAYSASDMPDTIPIVLRV